jgi:hypothetical protein
MNVLGLSQKQLDAHLRSACLEGHLPAVVYLLDSGANPFAQDEHNDRTPCIIAAQYGYADIIAACCCHTRFIGSSVCEEGIRLCDGDFIGLHFMGMLAYYPF